MPNERAIIFANGNIEHYEQVRGILRPGDFLISADGGLRHLTALNLIPVLVVGDLDFVAQDDVVSLNELEIEIQLFPKEKNETDLELALIEAAKRGYTNILVMGALGGRTDHSLANLALLGLPELAGLEVKIINGHEEISLIRDHAVLIGAAGDLVSLLPVNGSATGVSTHGLKYPLVSETLLPVHSRGISNVMLTNRAEVTLKSGSLLCIHTRTKMKEEK